MVHSFRATDRARSVPGRERLDPPGIADEGDHDTDAKREEQRLQDVDTVFAKAEQIGKGPAGGECRPEDLGADQDGRAHHSEHMDPDDLAAFSRWVAHDLVLMRAGNLPETAGGIKSSSHAASRLTFGDRKSVV